MVEKTIVVAPVEVKPKEEKKGKKKKKKGSGNKERVLPPGQLTPYQGKRRSYGFFHCKDCKTEWTSAFSWANTFQLCKQCNGKVYPYRQIPLQRSVGAKTGKPPHQRHLCGKCMELGRPCTEKANFCN